MDLPRLPANVLKKCLTVSLFLASYPRMKTRINMERIHERSTFFEGKWKKRNVILCTQVLLALGKLPSDTQKLVLHIRTEPARGYECVRIENQTTGGVVRWWNAALEAGLKRDTENVFGIMSRDMSKLLALLLPSIARSFDAYPVHFDVDVWVKVTLDN